MKHLIALAVFCAAAGYAQPSLEARLDEMISTALAASGAPGVSVAVMQNGRTVYAKAFGKADLEQNRAATAGTRYAVGSISKQFTAAAILLAAEQGKLSLDDKVGKYFPKLTRSGETTVRQLLSHTAGYEDYAPQDYIIPEWTRPTTAQAVMERWATKPLNFDPGTRWQYSNTGYVIAGAIFEKATGRGLVEFLKEKIFDPLGMTTASDCDARNPADATAYTRYALGPSRPVAREAPGWYFAAGELCMTAADLSKWNAAFAARKILSSSSYDQMMKEVKLADGKPTHYGLGLQLGEVNGAQAFSHGGEVSGFLANNIIFPTRNASVSVLSNSDGLNLTSTLGRQIAQLLTGGEPPAPAPASEIEQVRKILAGLQNGTIDRALFSENANSYFTAAALADFRSSLAPLGAIKSVTRTSDSLRGGMTHRAYRAQFEKGSVTLNNYLLSDGRYEQFMVMGPLQ